MFLWGSTFRRIDSSAEVCAIRHPEPSIDINTFSYVARGSNINEENWINVINSEVGAIENKIIIFQMIFQEI